jgi:hypothetical protein
LFIFLLMSVLVVSLFAFVIYNSATFNNRRQFVSDFTYPPSAMRELAKHHPTLTERERQLVADGLTQYFQVYLKSGFKSVSMPSQVVDDLWHAFILDTRAYKAYCDQAFGRFFHHTPAVVMSKNKQTNEGLRRVWWHTCKFEGLDPRNTAKLPLIFDLDTRLRIPGGYRYTANCEALRAAGVAGTQCGGDFTSTSFDGGTAGLSDSSSDGSSSDGGGGDGGGGGCGGGGGD